MRPAASSRLHHISKLVRRGTPPSKLRARIRHSPNTYDLMCRTVKAQMSEDDLTHAENQERLKAAARCTKCKEIWATYSNRFCSTHSVATWLATVRQPVALSIPEPVSGKIETQILHTDKTVLLEKTRLDLGMSREQISLALRLLGIVPILDTGAARIRISDDRVLRNEFQSVRHPTERKSPPRPASQSHATVPQSQPRPAPETRSTVPRTAVPRQPARRKFVLPTTTNCEMANFDGHELDGLKKADFSGYSFVGASFRNCLISNTSFDEMNLSKVRFTNSVLRNCRFRRADLSKTKLDSATIEDCDFYGARLVRSTFSRSKVQAKFVRIFAHEADFRSVEFGPSDFFEANLQGSTFANAILLAARFTRSDLKWVCIDRAKFDQAQFSDEQIEAMVAPREAVTVLDRHHLNSDGRPKRRFSQDAASRVVKQQQSRGDRNATAYKCPTCGMWHIGH